MVDSGLFASCSVWYLTQEYTGPIHIFGQTTVENFNDAKEALYDEIEKFDDDDYFTDEEMNNAKSAVEIERIYDLEITSDLVTNSLAFWWCVADLDYYLDYAESINEIGRDEMKEYVVKYVIGEPRIVGVLISPEGRSELTLEESDLV